MHSRIRFVMSPKDYSRFKLTGEICTEYSDASATLAFSVKERKWCRELIRRFELKEDIWPEVLESQAAAGTNIYKDIYEACDAVVKMNDEIIEPVPENVRYYKEKLPFFEELYKKLEEMFISYY